MYFQALEPIERVIKNREWQLYGFPERSAEEYPWSAWKKRNDWHSQFLSIKSYRFVKFARVKSPSQARKDDATHPEVGSHDDLICV
jgi:hypothetical protein